MPPPKLPSDFAPDTGPDPSAWETFGAGADLSFFHSSGLLGGDPEKTAILKSAGDAEAALTNSGMDRAAWYRLHQFYPARSEAGHDPVEAALMMFDRYRASLPAAEQGKVPTRSQLVERGRSAAVSRYYGDQDVLARSDSLGGAAAGFAGSAVGSMADPLNIAAMVALRYPATSILKTIGIEAAGGIATQAAIEPFAAARLNDLGIDYDWSDSLRSIAGAGAGAGALGGLWRAAEKGVVRSFGGTPIDEIRAADRRAARNVLSDADAVDAENPYRDAGAPTAAGAAAVERHRTDAMRADEALIHGAPVTPAMAGEAPPLVPRDRGREAMVAAAQVLRDEGADAPIAKLSDEAWSLVEQGADVRWAELVGRLVPDASKHAGVLRAVEAMAPGGPAAAESVIRDLTGPRAGRAPETIAARARLKQAAIGQLVDTLDGPGGAGRAREVRDADQLALLRLRREAHGEGWVGQALDAAARRLGRGEPLTQTVGGLVDDLRAGTGARRGGRGREGAATQRSLSEGGGEAWAAELTRPELAGDDVDRVITWLGREKRDVLVAVHDRVTGGAPTDRLSKAELQSGILDAVAREGRPPARPAAAAARRGAEILSLDPGWSTWRKQEGGADRLDVHVNPSNRDLARLSVLPPEARRSTPADPTPAVDLRSPEQLSADGSLRALAFGDGDIPTGAELRAAAKEVVEADKADLVREFGGDEKKAARFRSLERKADTAGGKAADDAIAELDQLREEMVDEIESVAREDEHDLRRLASAFEEMEEDAKAIPQVTARFLSDLPHARELAEAKGDTSRWTAREVLPVLVLRKALAVSKAAGADAEAVMREIISTYARRFDDPEDAKFMVQSVLDVIKPKKPAARPARTVALRYLRDADNNLYVWRGDLAIHQEVAEGLNRELGVDVSAEPTPGVIDVQAGKVLYNGSPERPGGARMAESSGTPSLAPTDEGAERAADAMADKAAMSPEEVDALVDSVEGQLREIHKAEQAAPDVEPETFLDPDLPPEQPASRRGVKDFLDELDADKRKVERLRHCMMPGHVE